MIGEPLVARQADRLSPVLPRRSAGQPEEEAHQE
jgi:hypothetical protein